MEETLEHEVIRFRNEIQARDEYEADLRLAIAELTEEMQRRERNYEAMLEHGIF